MEEEPQIAQIPQTMDRSGRAGASRDKRTYSIIGAAMEVHRVLGPGRLEAVYQEALEIELTLRKIPYVPKPKITVRYKGRPLEAHYRPDFVVMSQVVVEIKAQACLGRADHAQILNALVCSGLRVGLLVNFGEQSLVWQRFVN